MPTTCQKYKQKLKELQELSDKFKAELKRVNKDGKEHNGQGESIIELKEQIQIKVKEFEIEFEEFVELKIKAKTPEGIEVEFKLKEILNYSKEFYRKLNLDSWADALLDTLKLSQEQIEKLQQNIEKHGFNKMLIYPPVEIQNKTLETLLQETTKPIPGLDENEQYGEMKDDGTRDEGFEKWFSDDLKDIKNINRPEGKCYIQLYKDEQEVPNETLDQTYPQARQYQKDNNLQGYTLAEYLIFQREFTIQNKKHPEHTRYSWLTDSELPFSQVLYLNWNPGARQVRVDSAGFGIHGADLGFRSSAVLSV